MIPTFGLDPQVPFQLVPTFLSQTLYKLIKTMTKSNHEKLHLNVIYIINITSRLIKDGHKKLLFKWMWRENI